MTMAEDQITKAEEESIIRSIKEAELNTSGEVQVHIENHCKEEVLDRAAEVFAILKMHKTKSRNGVLFYLAIKDHKFAILGDAGINRKVPANFWDDIKAHMASHFQHGNIVAGLCEGIHMAGKALKEHFPYQKNDTNELPDNISFGKN